jgi:hypothetical protein
MTRQVDACVHASAATRKGSTYTCTKAHLKEALAAEDGRVKHLACHTVDHTSVTVLIVAGGRQGLLCLLAEIEDVHAVEIAGKWGCVDALPTEHAGNHAGQHLAELGHCHTGGKAVGIDNDVWADASDRVEGHVLVGDDAPDDALLTVHGAHLVAALWGA